LVRNAWITGTGSRLPEILSCCRMAGKSDTTRLFGG
jgi:hypothetical protein